MTWRAKWVSVTTQGVNIVPTVEYINDATGETITEDYRADNITQDLVKARVDKRIAQLTTRDYAKATFDDVTPGAPIDPN